MFGNDYVRQGAPPLEQPGQTAGSLTAKEYRRQLPIKPVEAHSVSVDTRAEDVVVFAQLADEFAPQSARACVESFVAGS